MKQLRGWLTLFFAGLSALLMSVTLLPGMAGGAVLTRAVAAAALCWGFGFLWFVRYGRASGGGMRQVYSAAFYLLCTDLLLCLGLCGFLGFFC